MGFWKEAMAKYHGEDWREKLLNLEPPEEEDDGEEDSQPEESLLEVFRRPKAEDETVAGFDARRLRAGKILLGKHPRQLSAADQLIVELLREVEGKDERETRNALKVTFFDALQPDERETGEMLAKLLGCLL